MAVKVNDILQFLEDNLDCERIENTRKHLKKTINYQLSGAMTVKGDFPGERRFEPYPYSETFNDMEKMLVNQLIPCCRAIDVENTLPMIRANYGVVILPSVFGAKYKLVDNNMPWCEPFGSVEEIKKLLDRGIPDLKNGLGAMVFDTHEYYNECLSKYPKCQKLIPIYHPDLQGPFDVAHLLWGPEIYLAIYDHPGILHQLMKLITETYIAFMKAVKKNINDEYENCVYHWGTLYRGKIVLRNDTAVNLSKEAYEEFVKPYDEQILKEFGGGSIHYCGRADQWIFSMMECEGLGALNFGQPPNMTFGIEFLQKIYRKANKKKIAIIGYYVSKELLKEAAQLGFKEGITYNTSALNKEEAIALLEELER